MKIFPYFTLFAVLFLFGCGSDSGSSSGVASSDASTPLMLPSNSETVIAYDGGRRSLTMSGDLSNGGQVNASYSDSADASLASISIPVIMSIVGDEVTLSFTTPIGDFVWKLSQFSDIGGDGLTDEFTINETINNIQSTTSIGQFLGGAKPTNENISESERLTTEAVKGAPTPAEFLKYIVGFSFAYINETSDSSGFISFIDSTRWFDSDGDSGTYNYTKIDEDTGLLEISDSADGETLKVELDCNTFYDGTWTDDPDNDSGTFQLWGSNNINQFNFD